MEIDKHVERTDQMEKSALEMENIEAEMRTMRFYDPRYRDLQERRFVARMGAEGVDLRARSIDLNDVGFLSDDDRKYFEELDADQSLTDSQRLILKFRVVSQKGNIPEVTEKPKSISIDCFSNEQADQLRFELAQQGLNPRIELVDNKPRRVKTGE